MASNNDKGFFSETWEQVIALTGSLFRHGLAEKLGATVRSAFHNIGFGVGAGELVNLYATWREYKNAQDEMRNFYAPEIGARLGKKAEDVTVDDLYKAAETNPTIAESIRRNKTARNVNFGVNTISLVAGITITEIALTGLLHAGIIASAVGLPAFAAGMAIGLGMFLAFEKPLEYVSKKIFGLDEPSLKAAGKHLGKQGQLSLPSQIRCIEHLQQKQMPITHDHVMTAFIAADPALGEHITNTYGGEFTRLSAKKREQVVHDIGGNYGIPTIASHLASRLMRAQELAYMIHGQSPLPVAKAPAPAPVMVAEEDASPTFSYRTRILEERKQAQQPAPEAPAQLASAQDNNAGYRTVIIEERKAAAQQGALAAT